MAVQKNFVVHNGLEVNETLIYADAIGNKVGINTIYPQAALDVRGEVKSRTLNVAGISTLTDVKLLGGVSAGSTTGVKGQYLISTGAGVTWAEPLNTRIVTSQTGSPGQTIFNVSYTLGFLDVYINGIRLSEAEFTAIDGSVVTLDSPCFGGESIDFITYDTTSATAIQGISVAEDGILVGAALSTVLLNFTGNGVNVASTGVAATITINYDIKNSQWVTGSSGIYTGSNVGIATTNPIQPFQVGSNSTAVVINNQGKLGIGTTNPSVNLSVLGGSNFGGIFERVSVATTYLSNSVVVLELDCQQATTYTYTIPDSTNVGIVSFKNMLTQTGTANGTTVTVIFTQNATGTGNTTSATGIGTNITIVGYENGATVAGISTGAFVGNGTAVTLSTTGNDTDFASFYIYYNGGLNTSANSYKVFVTKNGNFR